MFGPRNKTEDNRRKEFQSKGCDIDKRPSSDFMSPKISEILRPARPSTPSETSVDAYVKKRNSPTVMDTNHAKHTEGDGLHRVPLTQLPRQKAMLSRHDYARTELIKDMQELEWLYSKCDPRN